MRPFCFGSSVVLDVVCGYVLLFLLDTPPSNFIPVILFLSLSVPRRLFCFGSLVVLDVVCGYVLLFLLDIKKYFFLNR